MSFIFTADWHINLNKSKVPYNWQYNRYLKLAGSLLDVSYEHGVLDIVIGGDVFDKYPTLEEQELFHSICRKLETYNRNVVIFDGNHEATKKGKTFLTPIKEIFRSCRSTVSIITEQEARTIGGLNVDILPYNRLHSDKKYVKTSDILLTHVRGNVEPYIKSEIDLGLLNDWEAVYAGDLHDTTYSQLNISYPGEPLTTTFNSSTKERGVFIVTAPNQHKFIPLSIPQMLDKKVESEDEMVPTEVHHTVYTFVGSKDKVTKTVKNSELLNKIADTKVSSKVSYMPEDRFEELSYYLTEVRKVKNPEELVALLSSVLYDS